MDTIAQPITGDTVQALDVTQLITNPTTFCGGAFVKDLVVPVTALYPGSLASVFKSTKNTTGTGAEFPVAIPFLAVSSDLTNHPPAFFWNVQVQNQSSNKTLTVVWHLREVGSATPIADFPLPVSGTVAVSSTLVWSPSSFSASAVLSGVTLTAGHTYEMFLLAGFASAGADATGLINYAYGWVTSGS